MAPVGTEDDFKQKEQDTRRGGCYGGCWVNLLGGEGQGSGNRGSSRIKTRPRLPAPTVSHGGQTSLGFRSYVGLETGGRWKEETVPFEGGILRVCRRPVSIQVSIPSERLVVRRRSSLLPFPLPGYWDNLKTNAIASIKIGCKV